ncbi:induced myeloid leukemia cell differentiation protein Mcl-1 homolog [Polypterus senegalus]|uniref:induced myeloid leukemia cell differentiation protein Mcl-1 homolog n=1 Tax=Polypterus senegalus TaxID=55291 RepID=UPI00196468BD|nr:induced myeloid leukemia cell differentiation protein Mcl-1 homolog [Polypterus senegalus]
MLRKLNISQEGDMGFMTPVAESIFSDGVINWGRVVSLVAFGAVVAKHLKQVNLERCIRPLADQISTFLLTRQKDWIVNNRAWEGFVEFFRIEDPEAGIRQALITFAGMAGLGAGIAYLIR